MAGLWAIYGFQETDNIAIFGLLVETLSMATHKVWHDVLVRLRGFNTTVREIFWVAFGELILASLFGQGLKLRDPSQQPRICFERLHLLPRERQIDEEQERSQSDA